MSLYKTSEYAIRILVFMSMQDQEVFSAMHLHKGLKMPYKYPGKHLRNVAKAGLLEALRGKRAAIVLRERVHIV
ncbi:MAG: Rrf2 family transcriptional regulator [Candidatus Krumholzibacteria bacterium]|jgi:DNA-binding IscR family transcriptional regulator|nr:Rrf2 family transcriptional regulator [Candidatus Krumholzibacteria bacterium]MDP6668357.1 Rrf2 family transcriptional regulator [Candidatus Krumholzibacteria bacterium]MDP6796284.1 Rrf2 family transcriptional regulator [Candidatus Krumholzibacteria bacterium]MDP7022188.1 Rrf2 family transcriptional regulator [Candidatus Krumholzibacteria bacterium]